MDAPLLPASIILRARKSFSPVHPFCTEERLSPSIKIALKRLHARQLTLVGFADQHSLKGLDFLVISTGFAAPKRMLECKNIVYSHSSTGDFHDFLCPRNVEQPGKIYGAAKVFFRQCRHNGGMLTFAAVIDRLLQKRF
jgi:hypothetical protein